MDDEELYKGAYRRLIEPATEYWEESNGSDDDAIDEVSKEQFNYVLVKNNTIPIKAPQINPQGILQKKLRPVLDCRMPTLATKAAFALPLEDMPPLRKQPKGLKRLEDNPPRSLRDLRNIITSELNNIGKKLSRLERSYYGVGKSVQTEVDKYVTPLKGVMRMLTVFDLASVSSIENAIKAGMDPKRYKGDPNNIVMLKEVFTKLQTYVPEKFSDIIDACRKILDILEQYYVSFYDPAVDGYLETAAHFEEQISTWKRNIRTSLDRVQKLQREFKERMIHYSMFTPPVATFCKKNECEPVPFVLIFADACTNIRAAMTVMTSWLQADENYPIFLRNDIEEMERRREEKIKLLRESKQNYHSSLYKLNQAEIEHKKAISETKVMNEKEQSLKMDVEYLFNYIYEQQIDLEVKEFRRDEFRKKKPELPLHDFNDVYDTLTDEIRSVKDRMPESKRQLAAAQLKLEWMNEKKAHMAKIEKEMRHHTKALHEAEKETKEREEDYTKLEKALELSRKIHRYKTSPDIATKIYMKLPVRPHGQAISIGPFEDTMQQACDAVCETIDDDWMELYRTLTFYPKRGKLTIEKDISTINQEGSRGPKQMRPNIALHRWRRYHTRANVDDIKTALRKIKRWDVLQALENAVNPPKVENDVKEIYVPPNVAPELVPFYREIERYDQMKAAHKMRTGR